MRSEPVWEKAAPVVSKRRSRIRLGEQALLAVVVVTLLLATGLRFYRLGAQSFWNDEGNSARLSERSLPLIIEGTASDIHPPLYYLVLRGWRDFAGEHEFGLRSFSAFAGILTVAGSYALARLFLPRGVRRRWAAVAVMLLAAINPALVYYSQETRMYALLALLALLSTVALWRWLRARRAWGWASGYVLLATAGLYTHYFFPAVLVVHNLLILVWLGRYLYLLMFSPLVLVGRRRLRQTFWAWVGMMVLVFVLYLPWLPVFLRQAGGREGARAGFFAFLWESVRWQALGETVVPGTLLWGTVGLLLLLLLGLWRGGRFAVPALIGAGVPVLFMYVAGTTDPAFYKFMLVAVPFTLLLAGMAFGRRGEGPLRDGAAVLLGAGVAAGMILSLSNLYFDPAFARADYRGMVAQIAADNHPDAGIILNAPNQWEVFTYYHQDGAPVYPLPKGQPDPALLEPELEAIAAQHDRLYALFWGEGQRDPQRVVERWLDAHAFKASERWVGDVRFVVYAMPREPAETMEVSVGAAFGDSIALLGYTLGETTLVPGDIAQVTLFWEATAPIGERYKVFLHLLDADGNLVAQRDSEPGGGLVPTTAWASGETVVDNHGLLLPNDLAPGIYTLIMGLYEADDAAARLQVGQDSGDSTRLGQIRVTDFSD